jgi:hypothetical protein
MVYTFSFSDIGVISQRNIIDRRENSIQKNSALNINSNIQETNIITQ